MTLVRDWIVLTFMRLLNALGWPVWVLCLIGVVVVPIFVVKRLREGDRG